VRSSNGSVRSEPPRSTIAAGGLACSGCGPAAGGAAFAGASSEDSRSLLTWTVSWELPLEPLSSRAAATASDPTPGPSPPARRAWWPGRPGSPRRRCRRPRCHRRRCSARRARARASCGRRGVRGDRPGAGSPGGSGPRPGVCAAVRCRAPPAASAPAAPVAAARRRSSRTSRPWRAAAGRAVQRPARSGPQTPPPYPRARRPSRSADRPPRGGRRPVARTDRRPLSAGSRRHRKLRDRRHGLRRPGTRRPTLGRRRSRPWMTRCRSRRPSIRPRAAPGRPGSTGPRGRTGRTAGAAPRAATASTAASASAAKAPTEGAARPSARREVTASARAGGPDRQRARRRRSRVQPRKPDLSSLRRPFPKCQVRAGRTSLLPFFRFRARDTQRNFEAKPAERRNGYAGTATRLRACSRVIDRLPQRAASAYSIRRPK
jgi:hypothetical protein